MYDDPLVVTPSGFVTPPVRAVSPVQVHVLSVPGKGSFPHPKVQVGSVDPIDANAVVLVDVVQDRAQLVDVPLLAAGGKSEQAWRGWRWGGVRDEA